MKASTKPKKRADEHVIWKSPATLACLHCGSHYEINLPAPVEIVAGASESFSKTHKTCRLSKARGLACAYCFEFGHDVKTCPLTLYGGDWRKWKDGPDTGTSSLTICRRLSGQSLMHVQNGGGVPYDPADFGRCHRLLHAIPGWRARIGEMRDESGWAPLVDAWDELEALYLKELPKGRCPKLYDRMSKLLGHST